MDTREQLFDGMREAGFAGQILKGPAVRAVYGTDNSIYQVMPRAVVVPTSAADIVALATANARQSEPANIVARGGGTGTNGQSLGDDIIVDTRRAMNRIISIDPEAREAVVEPGVVLDQLNAAVATHGLFFAPHVSTSTRATIGGMVSTDAAGKGSLVYGRTNRHVLALGTVLADGTEWECVSTGGGDQDHGHAGGDRIGALYRDLADAVSGVDGAQFPQITRGFTGYNLAGAAAGSGGLDPTKLICGSEGTLALITRVTVRLTPVPQDVRLAVIAYGDFDTALRDADRLKAAAPIAIECLDERTISLARSSDAFPHLARLIDPGDGALLLLEFDGPEGLEVMTRMLDPALASPAVTADPAAIAAVWRVRKDAVGLLGQAVGGRRSVAFVEDCSVPPAALEEFVAGYRAILESSGLSYGMFGHADVGCVHVRPALDLYDPAQEQLVRAVSDEVAGLVGRLGGVVWGEHGRGFRGEFNPLAPELTHRMRQVKTAFDPLDILNPGKLYRPLDATVPIRRIDEVPLRVHSDRQVAVGERRHFDTAFACNGNGICHHWSDAAVMCPSFKVTGDPALSPKGRSDLIRAWLGDPDDRRLAADVATSMHACLSCSACTGTCPVGVDMPELKSRFLERHHDRDVRRRLRNAVISRFEPSLPAAARATGVARTAQRLLRAPFRSALGVVDLPSVAWESPADVVARLAATTAVTDDLAAASVIVLPDAFTAYLEPSVLDATLRVMVALGEAPAVGPFVASGKFDHVKGRRRRFARVAADRRRLLERLPSGVPLVVIEPAIGLLERHEYPNIDPTYPDTAVTPLAAHLDAHLTELATIGGDGARERALLLGHCAETSLAPHHTDAYRRVLERVGLAVDVPAVTCCGMAGVFGHEAEHLEMSTALFDLSWRPRLDEPGYAVTCAPGYSCRSQIARLSGARALHPVEVIADRLGL